MMMMITRVLRSKLKATALRAMLPEIAPTGSQLTSRVRCEGGHHVWIVIQGSIYFEFEHYVLPVQGLCCSGPVQSSDVIILDTP
jgi:hypothetical protein